MNSTQIRTLMQVADIKPKALAVRLNISEAQVSRLVNGKRTAQGPTLKLLEQMQSRYRRKLEAVE